MSLVDFLREKWRLTHAERANERKRIEDIKRIEAQQAAEEHRQKVQEQAYLFWEADGKPEGKDDYYWKLAVDKVKGKDGYYWKLKGKNVPTIYKPYYFVDKRILEPIIYKPYYFLEKRILEPMDAWISKQAFFTIATQLAILAAIIAFIGSENTRRNNEIFNAWQTITSANGQSGSGGRIEALEFLNSRPLKFPWIGVTIDLFGDENECELKSVFGRRWKREPLAGLSTPKAYLVIINLCGANLSTANLQEANLLGANLQKANLSTANLQKAKLRGANLQKAKLRGANLQEANLLEANLQEARLLGANLQDADLIVANLQRADLYKANLQEADLIVANLQEANLYKANLQEANLLGANLQKAKLRGANLQEARLLGANLQDANLHKANLKKAILVGTENLTTKQIKSTCFWDRAIYKVKYREIDKGKLNWNQEEEETFVVLVAKEPDNTKFIKELKNDTASDPEEPPDCSRWENQK